MKPQHTPGPWRVGDAGRAVFGPPNGKPSPQTVAHVPHKANARLIAEAPAMLEALRALADWAGNQSDVVVLAARAILTRIEGAES